MIICKVCDVNNSEDSKFCIECGVGLGNGNAFSKTHRANLQLPDNVTTETIKLVKKEMQNMDRVNAPILGIPKKSLEDVMFEKHPIAKQPVINPIDEKIKTIAEETRLDLNNPKEYGVFTNAKQVRKAKNQREVMPLGTTQKILENIQETYLCGVCGTLDCEIEHIPSIQQQYQEAFENIWHLRHRKYLKYCLSQNPRELDVTELREYGLRGRIGYHKYKRRISDIGVDSTARADGKSMKIPKEPFKSIRIRK